MTAYKQKVQDGFDPLDPEVFAGDYWSVLSALQREYPVLRTDKYGGLVLLTHYDDITQAASSWETFTSTQGTEPIPFEHKDPNFRFVPLENDPPFHRQVRKALNPLFSAASADELDYEVTRVVNELIDGFVEDGSCEFMSKFAQPYPAMVVGRHLIGLDGEDLYRIVGWIRGIVSEPHRAAVMLDEYRSWTMQFLQDHRSGIRKNAIVTTLLEVQVEAGRHLTLDECAGALAVLLIGGLETVISALGNIFLHLSRNPELRKQVTGSPEALERAVDEFLRYEAPAPALRRTTTCPVTIQGNEIQTGERVLLYYGAANRDPSRFPDPDVLDVTRDARKHLSFGFGPHLCIGRHIARLELRVAIREFIRRIPEFSLVEEPEYAPSMSRGPERLMLTWPTQVTSR